jgi:hypothetical protein
MTARWLTLITLKSSRYLRPTYRFTRLKLILLKLTSFHDLNDIQMKRRLLLGSWVADILNRMLFNHEKLMSEKYQFESSDPVYVTKHMLTFRMPTGYTAMSNMLKNLFWWFWIKQFCEVWIPFEFYKVKLILKQSSFLPFKSNCFLCTPFLL